MKVSDTSLRAVTTPKMSNNKLKNMYNGEKHGKDSDNDNDTEKVESASAKASEAGRNKLIIKA